MYSVSCLSVNGQWTVLFVIPEQRLFITFKGNLYRIVIAMAMQQLFNLGISVLLFYFFAKTIPHRGNRVADVCVAVFGTETASDVINLFARCC